MKIKSNKCLNIVKKDCIDFILKIYENIEKLIKQDKLKKKFKNVKLSSSDVFLNSSFITLPVKDFIYKKINFVEILNVNIFDTLFVVKHYSSTEWSEVNDDDENDDNKQRLTKLIEALSIVIGMSQWSQCSLKNRTIIINMFDVDIPKEFVPYKKIIEPKHVNSAYTIPCRYLDTKTNTFKENLEVVIFRNEEWEKVLFHELMHLYSYDMDIEDNNILVNSRLSEIFNVSCDFKLTEAYTEFWARILYCLWKTKGQKQDFKKEIEKQQLWSIYQGLVVLTNTDLIDNVLGWKIGDNISSKKTDKTNKSDKNDNKIIKNNPERTAAFSYYVIAGLMMSNWKNILAWCIDNNDDNDYDDENSFIPFKFKNSLTNIKNFIKMINKTLNDKDVKELWSVEEGTLPEDFCKYSLSAKMII